MPNLGGTTIEINASEEFKKLLEQAKIDFKRIHTEFTDDLKRLVAEEVERQMNEYHAPVMKG